LDFLDAGAFNERGNRMKNGIVVLLLLSLSLVTGCGQKTVRAETGRTGVPETSLLRGNEKGERLMPLAIVVSWLEKESRNLLI
jgi:hypothetical protein